MNKNAKNLLKTYTFQRFHYPLAFILGLAVLGIFNYYVPLPQKNNSNQLIKYEQKANHHFKQREYDLALHYYQRAFDTRLKLAPKYVHAEYINSPEVIKQLKLTFYLSQMGYVHSGGGDYNSAINMLHREIHHIDNKMLNNANAYNIYGFIITKARLLQEIGTQYEAHLNDNGEALKAYQNVLAYLNAILPIYGDDADFLADARELRSEIETLIVNLTKKT